MQFSKRSKVSQMQKVNTEELIQPYIQVISEKNSCIINTVGNVNELLQFMTNLDYVKEMIQDANSQSRMIESVATSSEEMAASTEDISNYVQESNVNMKHAMEETGESLKQVDLAFKQVESNISEIDAVSDIMNEVINETIKINELVNVIKTVADQTNLLSLNASIEAARAGEHGRGFAVVANEIKKLAENTKEQVDIIQSIVDGLNLKINKASDEIERVVSTFDGSKVAINEATGGIKNINVTMSSIENSFTSITANIEEQTAASQEMSSNLQLISDKAVRLRDEADRTGQAFFDISQKVDNLRVNALCNIDNLDPAIMIKLSITDHLMWKWRVYNMILGYIQLDANTVGDHHSCRLGQWLSTLDKEDGKISSILADIEQPHSDIHKAAKKAILEFNNGNKVIAEQLLPEIENNSKIVVAGLNSLGTYL